MLEVISSLHLVRYKGFQDCEVPLGGTSILVGANNAGKSTIIHALRLVAALIPAARRLNATFVGESGGSTVRGWQVSQAAIEAANFSNEAIRFDFREAEARVELRFDNGCLFVVTWPTPSLGGGDNPAPFFHIEPPSRFAGTARQAARDLLPDIAVVPTLAPLDDHETEITERAVTANLTGRRTSRYFRNALSRFAQDSDWEDLKQFYLSNTPEILGIELIRREEDESVEYDLFYLEPGTKHEREIVWAGEGLQIWLQVLFHLWRQRDAPVVVLDEPDVFLHPDLQRRLARLLLADSRQCILATHSIEVLAESDAGTAVFVDRSRNEARRSDVSGGLSQMGRRLGSGLELSVARALRNKIALFVEGQDLRILSILADRSRCPRVARGDALSVIPLGGFSRHQVAGAFADVVHMLGGDVRVGVLLDRDLRSQAAVELVIRGLTTKGVEVHVWRRRELESYLLDPGALARVARVPTERARTELEAAITAQRSDAETDLIAARLDERKRNVGSSLRLAEKTVIELARAEFEILWSDDVSRLSIVDPKMVIKRLYRILGHPDRPISPATLARCIEYDDIPGEVRSYLQELEERVTGT